MIVAFDTETALIQPGRLAPPMVCASFAGDNTAAVVTRAQGRLCELLAGPDIIAGANIAFDFAVAAAEDPSLLRSIFDKYDREEVWDVLIAQALDAIAGGHLGVDPSTGKPLRGRYSLDACVRLTLGRDDAKANDFWRLRYALLKDIPIDRWPADAKQYPLDDARNTLELAHAQQKFRNAHDMGAQARAAWALHLGAAWGIRADPVAVAAVRQRSVVEREKKRERFVTAGFLRADGTANTAVIKEAVVKAYGEMVPRTEKGAVSIGREVMADSGDELLEAYAEFGEDGKIGGTYLPFLEEAAAGPACLSPNPLLATGRCSYTNGPRTHAGVIQLLPRSGGIRECFVPRPGRLFFSSDYSGIELVTHAQNLLWTVGWSNLADALRSGGKPHDMLGATLAGVDLQQFDKHNKWHGTCRQAAKAANFGFPGGMGGAKFVIAKRREPGVTTTGPDGKEWKGLRLCLMTGGAVVCGEERVTEWRGRPTGVPVCRRCVEEAEKLREAWFSAWPENKQYFEYIGRIVDTDATVITHVSKRVCGGVKFAEAANRLFQALAADGGKAAFYEVMRDCYAVPSSPLYGTTNPIAFIHDEIFGEVDEGPAHEAMARVEEIQVGVMRRYVPDLAAAVEAKPALMRRWTKAAEPVYRDGRLVPWEAT